MSTRGKSRRTFLLDSVTGLGGAWVAANYAGILAAEDYVLKAAQSLLATKYHIEHATLQVEGGSSAQRCRELSW